MKSQECTSSTRSSTSALVSRRTRCGGGPSTTRTGIASRSSSGPIGRDWPLTQYTNGSKREPRSERASSASCPSAPPAESCPITSATLFRSPARTSGEPLRPAQDAPALRRQPHAGALGLDEAGAEQLLAPFLRTVERVVRGEELL